MAYAGHGCVSNSGMANLGEEWRWGVKEEGRRGRERDGMEGEEEEEEEEEQEEEEQKEEEGEEEGRKTRMVKGS